MKQAALRLSLVAMMLHAFDTASAVEFEKLGSAVAKALGTTKAAKKKATVDGKEHDVFFAKGGDGKPTKFAVVQKGIYEPNCTHTWVVGLSKDAKVEQVRVVEMSCPHAFPTNKASFLDQYKGKGPAEAKSLRDSVKTVAKATGSANLTTDAVVTAIGAAKAAM